ncbi:MAG: ACP S-malonyltransferase [Pseudomonadota bacterium]
MTKKAYVFPGQGSQSVGMLSELAAEHDQVLSTFSIASEAVGYDLWELCQQGPADKLNQTDITQPALLTASIACYSVYEEQHGKPDFFAGHSLGEYSALVAAEVMTLEDAVTLVETRGKLMQQAVPAGSGAMYAIIGLDDERIRSICGEIAQQTQQIVSPVNFNSPGQVVIAGNKDAVESAAVALKDAGAKRALPLAVSVPSHCALMLTAAQELAKELDNIAFNAPKVPVINNVDVVNYTDIEEIKNALVRQLHSPVRWTETVCQLVENGVEHIVEIGPGKVLTGLNKRIDKSLTLENFS